MDTRRVAITGLGVVSAAGVGIEALRAALQQSRVCLSELDPARAEHLTFKHAGIVRELVDADLGNHDRSTHMALVAAKEALAGKSTGGNVPVILGNSAGGLESIDAGYQHIYLQGRKRPAPRSVPKSMPSAPVSAIVAAYGFDGMAFAVSSACASAGHAIGLGAQLVASGAAERAVVGGCDAPLSIGNLRAWDALRAISASGCHPFSQDRNGTVLGEGAAMFVLEADHGQPAWGYLSGFGACAGNAEITEPSEKSFVLAMQRALASAGLARVDYVHAHGTGTPLNDVAEGRAIQQVVGAVPVSSSKGMLGHTIGASAAMGLAVTLLGMRDGFLPPCVGLTQRDPACQVDVVTSRRGRIDSALINSFAFGDLNTSLVVTGQPGAR